MNENVVAATAVGPMLIAAVEQHEPPQRRLVDDDLAGAFLPRRWRLLAALARSAPVRRALIAATDRSAAGLWAGIACRKRLIDERLTDPVVEYDAVVVLGAGLDTRASRIARHSDLPVFEVDRPAVIARKTEVLRRVLGGTPPSVHLVGADIGQTDLLTALADHGYRSDARTFFVAEGLFQYLAPEVVRATLAALSAAAPGSRLAFTYVRQDFLDGRERYGAEGLHRRFCGPQPVWRSGMTGEQVPELLADTGWRLVEQDGPSYYRDLYIAPTGRSLHATPLEWTVLAER
jgi:methyltransferase (TIGR00027 family)